MMSISVRMQIYLAIWLIVTMITDAAKLEIIRVKAASAIVLRIDGLASNHFDNSYQPQIPVIANSIELISPTQQASLRIGEGRQTILSHSGNSWAVVMRIADNFDATEMLYPDSNVFLQNTNRYHPTMTHEAGINILGTDFFFIAVPLYGQSDLRVKPIDLYGLLKSVDVTDANTISQWFDSFFDAYEYHGAGEYVLVVGRYIVPPSLNNDNAPAESTSHVSPASAQPANQPSSQAGRVTTPQSAVPTQASNQSNTTNQSNTVPAITRTNSASSRSQQTNSLMWTLNSGFTWNLTRVSSAGLSRLTNMIEFSVPNDVSRSFASVEMVEECRLSIRQNGQASVLVYRPGSRLIHPERDLFTVFGTDVYTPFANMEGTIIDVQPDDLIVILIPLGEVPWDGKPSHILAALNCHFISDFFEQLEARLKQRLSNWSSNLFMHVMQVKLAATSNNSSSPSENQVPTVTFWSQTTSATSTHGSLNNFPSDTASREQDAPVSRLSNLGTNRNVRPTEHLPFGVVQDIIDAYNLRPLPQERPTTPTARPTSTRGSSNNLSNNDNREQDAPVSRLNNLGTSRNVRPTEHPSFNVVQEQLNAQNLRHIPEERPTTPASARTRHLEPTGSDRFESNARLPGRRRNAPPAGSQPSALRQLFERKMFEFRETNTVNRSNADRPSNLRNGNSANIRNTISLANSHDQPSNPRIIRNQTGQQKRQEDPEEDSRLHSILRGRRERPRSHERDDESSDDDEDEDF